MRLYFDTSVLLAVFDEELPKRQEATNRLLDSITSSMHTGIISNIVMKEIEKGDEKSRDKAIGVITKLPLEIISENDGSLKILSVYEKEGFLRQGSKADLRHLAVATPAGVDAVVSWNFRDFVNIKTRRAVYSINIGHGWALVDIISPEEVVYE